MKLTKATDLLLVAQFICYSRNGLTLDEIEAEMECSRRSAQRVISALERLFPNIISFYHEDGRKYWKLKYDNKSVLSIINNDEIETIECAVEIFRANGLKDHAKKASLLKEKILNGKAGI